MHPMSLWYYLTSGFVGSSCRFLFLPDLVVRGEMTGGALHPRRTRSCEDECVHMYII